MTLQQQHLLHLSGATKLYNGHPVLNDVFMTIDTGTATALIGRNGSGKSTLLAILAGLLKLSSGSLLPAKPKLRISYAPEAFPGLKMSAEEYLYSMGRISGMSAAQLEKKIVHLLEAFQLTPFRKQAMTGYSKGMLQKVNLIQSLLGEPELLLLAGLIFAQSRRVIERADLVIIAALSLGGVFLLSWLKRLAIAPLAGSPFLTAIALAVMVGLVAIVLTTLFRLIYKIISVLIAKFL